MKKYKLLKDLPDLKAGAIFEWTEVFNDPITPIQYGSVLSNGRIKFVSADYVENNPEWFEEVKEVCNICNSGKDWSRDNYIEKDKIRELIKEFNEEVRSYSYMALQLEELIK